MIASLLLASALGAEPGFDAHGFRLAAQQADPRTPLALQRTTAQRAGAWFAGGVMEFADAPLVGIDADGNELPVLDNLFALDTSVGVVLHRRLRLDLMAPMVLSSRGQAGTQGPGMGDLRLASQVALLQPEADGLGLGVAPFLDLPTGSSERFFGQPGVAGGAMVDASLRTGPWTGTVNLGLQLNPEQALNNLSNADAVLAGLGLGYLPVDHLGLTIEALRSTPLARATEAGTGAPAEILGSARWARPNGAWLSAGVGTALSRGAGAAALRVVLGGGYGQPRTTVKTPYGGAPVAAPASPAAASPAPEAAAVEPSRLALRVRYQGHATAAELVLNGPEGEQQLSVPAEGLALQVADQAFFEARASDGPCLQGRATRTMAPGLNTLELELERRTSASLSLLAFDTNGEPVPGALIVLLADDPHCVPEEPLSVDGQGLAEGRVGAGTISVLFTADGYQDFEQVVEVASGGVAEVIAVMEPAP